MSDLASPLHWPVGWPRTKSPQRSRFGDYRNKPSVAKGTDGVLNELRMLRASKIVISTNLALRNDGLPRSNQGEPKDTGAAVYFEISGQPHVLPCDKWNTVGDNLWAIAKHVEALRGQKRWGVGDIQRAFAGYKALPTRSQQDPWEVLGISPQATEAQIMEAFRKLAKTAHPDAGGSHDAFAKLSEAKDLALSTLRHQ